jgi:acetylornithine deacetylase/succinyl-diaminopimelate desuccinylase-like protein
MTAMAARDLIHKNADTYVGWLKDACSMSSMAGDDNGLGSMSEWVEAKLSEVGASTRRLPYDGAPDAILGELGNGERTLLIYDHYDVQPVDPLDLWNSKPFEPEIRDGKLFARGAADNKGDLVARLAALDVYREVHGELPIALKFLVEGEEEVGSSHFETLTTKYRDDLAADGCIWEGHGIDHMGRPSFVFGAKGLAYVELTYRGLNDDQHSSLAAYVPSPAWKMVEALSTLRSPDGRVLIDGFYDDVVAPDETDLEMLNDYPFEEEAERERLGVEAFIEGDTGSDLVRRVFFEPTCNIAGIESGFTVPGLSKTVLPKEVLAKLDLRLVPEQDPNDIVSKLRKHLEAHGFGDIHVTSMSMEHPVRSPSDSLVARAALAALGSTFDQEPSVAPMMIGTGPMYPVAHLLGIPTVSPAGVARPDSNLHAPNENIRIDDFLKIIEYTVSYLKKFAEIDG